MSQSIEFHFPAARPKLQNLFPFDPKYDIQIQYKNNKYELQLVYLRLQSGYFKSLHTNLSRVIKIQQDFNEDYFEQIMKCFYGGCFKCPLKQVFEVWKILNYLKIDYFKKQTIKHVKVNFEKFNFYELLIFGYQNSIQDIFNHCLLILDTQNYSQLKQNKNQLLKCPLQVLKFILNLHNRRPIEKKSLNYIEINNLLKEYCEIKGYSNEFYNDLKFQLIQRTELNSQEYKAVFIEGAKPQFVKHSSDKAIVFEQNLSKNLSKLSESTQAEYSLISQNLNSQQKQHWSQKLHELKTNFQKDQKEYQSFNISIQNLSNIIKKKSEQAKINEENLSQMQILLRQIQKAIQTKSETLTKISERVRKLQNNSIRMSKKQNKNIQIQQQQQDDLFVQSHIIPGFVLGDMMAKNQHTNKKIQPSSNTTNVKSIRKIKKSINDKDDAIDYSYRNSLIFDKQPTCIPKRYLENLAKLLETDQFVKKKSLSLVFRKAKNGSHNVGDSNSIKNKNALLVLLQTNYKKYVGGYVSVQLPYEGKLQNICDYQSFLFSLTYNAKFPIRKGEQKNAISLSKHYLLSFGNDLMLSQDCLNQDSYCEWPSLYQTVSSSKCQSSKQLVGDSEFKIQQIQIYQVKGEQIEMVL